MNNATCDVRELVSRLAQEFPVRLLALLQLCKYFHVIAHTGSLSRWRPWCDVVMCCVAVWETAGV